MLRVLIAAALVYMALCVVTDARNSGQWDPSSPTAQWFKAQTVPGGQRKGASCCSDADGAKAQAEIRDGHWWVTFEACQNLYRGTEQIRACQAIDWMEVPQEAILDNYYNPAGAPIVWWGIEQGKIFIRCFARQPEV